METYKDRIRRKQKQVKEHNQIQNSNTKQQESDSNRQKKVYCCIDGEYMNVRKSDKFIEKYGKEDDEYGW